MNQSYHPAVLSTSIISKSEVAGPDVHSRLNGMGLVVRIDIRQAGDRDHGITRLSDDMIRNTLHTGDEVALGSSKVDEKKIVR